MTCIPATIIQLLYSVCLSDQPMYCDSYISHQVCHLLSHTHVVCNVHVHTSSTNVSILYILLSFSFYHISTLHVIDTFHYFPFYYLLLDIILNFTYCLNRITTATHRASSQTIISTQYETMCGESLLRRRRWRSMDLAFDKHHPTLQVLSWYLK